MITVRFAPSPTGYLHIGGARTALFNWIYARRQKGKFILRIEDTDKQRSKQEYVDEILESLEWLGLKWDELYFQSQRGNVYQGYAEQLLRSNKAYREGEAVILKIPKEEVVLYDLIRGEIRFDTDTIKDQVLIKSDGSPTYSFACVVDDMLMKVSHVIRGEDHISNTPKQILIYKALGLPLPKYAHLPLILDASGGRMSKRTGAVAVTEYRKMGFLPEGIVNYLLLLGWSPGNQEIITMKEAVEKFSLKKVNKTAAIFSLDKLRFVNGEHIKRKNVGELADLIFPLLVEKGYINQEFDRKKLESIIELFHTRMNTLQEFIERADFVFLREPKIPEDLKVQYLTSEKKEAFVLLSQRLNSLANFDAKRAEEIFRQLTKELGIKTADLIHPVRVALTGKTVGPGLFETMAVLGKEKTVQRLQAVCEILEKT